MTTTMKIPPSSPAEDAQRAVEFVKSLHGWVFPEPVPLVHDFHRFRWLRLITHCFRPVSVASAPLRAVSCPGSVLAGRQSTQQTATNAA